MGTSKTLSCLSIIANVLIQGRTLKSLLVASKSSNAEEVRLLNALREPKIGAILRKNFSHRSFGYASKNIFHNLTPILGSETI